jgi:hypothetical protein
LKNLFKTEGNITTIYCQYKGETIETTISTNRLPLVKKINAWNVLLKPNGTMYIQGRVSGRRVLLHRWIKGEPPGMVIDHDDRDTLNNIDNNLKVTTQMMNMRNTNVQKGSVTGCPGVTPYKGGYIVKIGVEGKLKHVGYDDDLDKAIQMRKDAEEEYWGTPS